MNSFALGLGMKKGSFLVVPRALCMRSRGGMSAPTRTKTSSKTLALFFPLGKRFEIDFRRGDIIASRGSASASSGGNTMGDNNNNNNNNRYYNDAFASPPLVVSNGDRLSGPGANRAIKWVPSDAKSSNEDANYYARETPSAPQWGGAQTTATAGGDGHQQHYRGYNNNGGASSSSSSSSYGGGGGYGGYNTNTNTNNSSSNNSNRTFVDFSIYKSKSALSVKLVKPTFETDSQGRTIMKRSGGILLEFAPSIGTRKYDWTRKGSFMLSPIEAAELANRLNPSRQSIAQKVEFFHDPGMGGSSQGSVTKSLKMEAMPDGTGGVFLNYSQTKFGEKLNVNIPVSFGEVSALELLIKHLVPRVMGFFDEDSMMSSLSSSSLNSASYGY